MRIQDIRHFRPDDFHRSFKRSLPLCRPQAVSAVAAEDGVRFMQEMMELSSQQQKEQLPPRAIQIVSHPFFGRVVLTAGPAQFGTDLSKSSTGVSGLAKLRGYKWSLKGPSVVVFFVSEALTFPLQDHRWRDECLLAEL